MYSFAVALLQEGPDGVIVLVREGEVAATVRSRAQFADDLARPRCFRQPTRQFHRDFAVASRQPGRRATQAAWRGRPNRTNTPAGSIAPSGGRRTSAHAPCRRARTSRFRNRVSRALGSESETLFDFDFHPQPLAVESVLIPQLFAAHGVIALVHVLQRPSPGVVHPHGIVRRDRPIEERPARPILRSSARSAVARKFVSSSQKRRISRSMAGKSRYSWNRSIHTHGGDGQKDRGTNSPIP